MQRPFKWKTELPILAAEKFYIVRHPQHKSVTAHSHLFFELTYILSGTVEHTIDGKTSTLHAGDYFLVDYGSTHGYRETTGKTFANLDCLFLPELLDPSLKGQESLRNVFEHYLVNYNMQILSQNPAEMVFHDDDGRILTLLQAIEQEAASRSPGYAELVRCHLIEILLLTMRYIKNASLAAGTQKISSTVISYISKHYMEDLSLSEIAERINYSLPYLSKCFKSETGISFIQYLQSHRIKQASRLLLTTKKAIPEIAEQVGYKDEKHFGEVFKKLTGVPPSAFRKLHRK